MRFLRLAVCVGLSLFPVLVAGQISGANDRLDEILREWQTATSSVRHLECEFSLFLYDHTFEVEQRGEGSLAVDTHGRAFFKVVPVTIGRNEKSRLRTKDGDPYSLQAVFPFRWYWMPARKILVDDRERVFVERILPESTSREEFQPEPPELPDDDDNDDADAAVAEDLLPKRFLDGSEPQTEKPNRDKKHPTFCEAVIGCVVVAAIVIALSRADIDMANSTIYEEFPLARPFLLGMPVADLKQNFRISLQEETATEAYLQFIPTKRTHVSFNKAIMILRLNDWKPMALKVIDATAAESVYVFKDVRINPQQIPGTNPFSRPNLKGYRRSGD